MRFLRKLNASGKARGLIITGESGMSIIEVLIASAIASFAIAAGMNTLISTNKNHVIQDGIVNMQQNGRATINELVGKVRQAGYKVPAGVASMFSWNSDPDTIAIVYFREPACTATVSANMPQPSAELKCTGSDLSCLVSDTWVYIWDPFAKEVSTSSSPVCRRQLDTFSTTLPAFPRRTRPDRRFSSLISSSTMLTMLPTQLTPSS